MHPEETTPVVPEPLAAPVVAAETENPILDPGVLNNLREISGDFGDEMLARLFTIYRENAPAALASLDEACDSSDLTRVSGAAHALKSMSGNVAATRLATKCEQLEQQAAAGNSSNIPTLHADIQQEFKLVMQVLEDDAQPQNPSIQAQG
jgi:HPt (histidine-containing phosphotransfer) domain-containing protein